MRPGYFHSQQAHPRPSNVPSDYPSERSFGDDSPLLFGIVTAIGITLLFQFGAAIAGALSPADDATPLLTTIPLGIAQLALMLLPTLYSYRAQPLRPSELLRLRPAPAASYVAAVVGMFALWQILQTYQIAQEIFLIPREMASFVEGIERESNSFFAKLFVSTNVVELLLALIVGCAIPGISEELLFRGVAQRSFERALRPATAIALAAFIFATLHLNPVNWMALFLLGIFFGYVAQRTGSILPTILCHFLFNSISVVALYGFAGDPLSLSTSHTMADLVDTLPASGVAAVLLAIVIRWLHRRRDEASGTMADAAE